ncbi:Histidine protein methyltransferase 1 like [Pseudolycoriella hygida]|uniref:protein-histidine N-methyltransferase n=1 Tax=Pseudolycoriella hygida TaxID=35572 RepID=A0A9Q0RYG9_9DIPT|nr:Histidine protein methyltransferase 1 like [Pseudolycoriella hygida]
MFKFDFQQNDEDLNEFGGIDENEDSMTYDSDNGRAPCKEFEEIQAKPSQICRPLISHVIYGSMTFFNDNLVRYIRMDADEERLLGMKGDHTDLIPGVYEGGGKIWECTQDLGDYVMKTLVAEDSTHKLSDHKNVLDLGCGAGILGILALKAGAFVHFSDYNASILSTLTIENVLLNFPETRAEILNKCKFYAGDWSNLVESTDKDTKYDVILTSETIYNLENYWKLLNVFKTKLKDNGIALVAAKTYYFGVGGGCREFERLIKEDGNLQSDVVFVVSENVQREILKVKFSNKAK